jgi:hypothetical protein
MTHTPKSIERIKSFGRRILGVAVTGAILFLALLMASPLTAQNRRFPTTPEARPQNPYPFPEPPTVPSPDRTEKQKEALVKYNFKEMKKHARQLTQLAQSLQKKIDQTNANVLSLEIVQKAEEIEKLAKKIKGEAKGY